MKFYFEGRQSFLEVPTTTNKSSNQRYEKDTLELLVRLYPETPKMIQAITIAFDCLQKRKVRTYW